MLCGVLPPGLIQYCSEHSCVIAVRTHNVCIKNHTFKLANWEVKYEGDYLKKIIEFLN